MMKIRANPWIYGGLSISGLALLLFCCFMSFVAHAWVNDQRGVWVTLFVAPVALFLTWKACRGSLSCGAGIFAAVLAIVWMPPWVIAPLPAMIIVTLIALLGIAGLFWLKGQKNEKSS